MNHTIKILDDLLFKSLNLFFEKEYRLIVQNVSERSWCGRLALHLESEKNKINLDSYYADVEYNRSNGGAKIINKKDRHGNDIVSESITCDLILHSRGLITENDNLIAIEMKKSGGRDKKSDKQRLRILTSTEEQLYIWHEDKSAFNYTVGYYIEINSVTMSCLVIRYECGKKIKESTINILQQKVNFD